MRLVPSRSLAFSLLAFALSFGLYRLALQDDRGTSVRGLPTLVADNYHGESFTPEGVLANALDSTHAVYHERAGTLALDRPRLVHYRHEGGKDTERWQLNADFADVLVNDKIFMRGNVVLVPLFRPAPINRAETDEMTLHTQSGTMETRAEVRVYSSGWQDVGKDFHGNLNDETYTLKDGANGGPHAVYFPSKR
ncbi:MAG: LPS export ABC transporter periplasmic protein LptC [Succinivibrionaceae bacterium]|nr:LPS export ABC transporter periplasmic protein LptC [Succinivibrionaceae bacterium]